MDRIILASDSSIIEEQFSCTLSNFAPIFNGCQNFIFPISIGNNDAFKNMSWGYYNLLTQKKYFMLPGKRILTDPRFQKSFRIQRCLIPCNAFTIMVDEQRYLIFSQKYKLFALAGIYHVYKDQFKNILYNFAILTRTSSPFLGKLSQMEEPIILSPNLYTKWFKSLATATAILQHSQELELNGYPIGEGIKDTSYNHKALLRAVGSKVISS